LIAKSHQTIIFLKKISTQVCGKKIYFFNEKIITLTKFLEYLKKKNLFKLSAIKKYMQFTQKKPIQRKIVNTLLSFTNFWPGRFNATILFTSLTLSTKISYQYYLSTKKNLKARITNFYFFTEFRAIISLFTNLSKIKIFKIKQSFKLSYNIEKNFKFYIKKVNQVKTSICLKNYIILKAEVIINSSSITDTNLLSNSLPSKKNSLKINYQRRQESIFLNIGDLFLSLIYKKINLKGNEELFFLKKSIIKEFLHIRVKQRAFINHFDFLEQRFMDFKNKMVKNRKNYFFVSHKKKTMKKKRERRFIKYFEDWSTIVRLIYKNLTATYINPLGGSIFFEYNPPQLQKKGGVVFSIFPLSNVAKDESHLSQGEHTLIVLAIFIAFNYVNSPPLIIIDEIDSHLDPLNLEKFFWLFKKLEKKRGWNSIIITQKNHLIFYFSQIIGIYKFWNGSKVHSFKY